MNSWRKLLFASLFLCLWSGAAFAQQLQFNQDFISSTQCVSVPSAGYIAGSYSVTEGWTGTLTAYGVVGQGAPVALQSETANGSYTLGIEGYTLFEVCGNTVASGTAFVQVYSSIPAAAGNTTLQGSGAPPATCSGVYLYYINTSNGDLYTCPTAGGSWVPIAGTTGSTAFGSVTPGTNTGALRIGSGGSLATTGSGTISATSVTGLNIAASKTLTVSNSLTLAGTDGSTLNIGTGGTLGAMAFGAYPASGIPSSTGSGYGASSTVVVNGQTFGGSSTSALVGENQPIDVGPQATNLGATLDARINAACLASYSAPGNTPVLDARGYAVGSTVLALTNPYDNCNRTTDLLLGNYTIAACVPWVLPHQPVDIEGVGSTQTATPASGTVIRAGTTADGCPSNFPGASGAVLNWTASGYLGAVFPHGPWNWYTTTGGFNNSGTYAVAVIYGGAMTQNGGANSLDWTVNSFNTRIHDLTIAANGLANFCFYTASLEEHTHIQDVVCNGPGLGNGISVTQVTNGSATVSGTFPYPNLLAGQQIQLNGTAAVVASATTSQLTLVGTFSGTTSSSVTFGWAGTTGEAVFDRMGNNGCAGTQSASGGVVTCTPTGSGGSPTQSGPGNSFIDGLQGAQAGGYSTVVNGTPYGFVFIGYGIEIYIWDASGAGTGARAYTSVATGGTLLTPVVTYRGSSYAAAGGGGTQCAVYSPISNYASGLTCTPTVSGGAVTAITLGGTDSGWATAANAVTGPTVIRGWGLGATPYFADDYYIAGAASGVVINKQCQGLNGQVSQGPLGSSCVHIGDGSGLTYGFSVIGVQAANETGSGIGPATLHIGADLDYQFTAFGVNQQGNSSGRPIIFDDRFATAVNIESTVACEGIAEYTYTKYDQCGTETLQASNGASYGVWNVTGTPYSGGNATTNYPLFFFNNSATLPTTWSTGGTYLGFNSASGFTGNVIDVHNNGGASIFSVNGGSGLTTFPAGSTSVPGLQFVGMASNTGLYSPAAAQLGFAEAGVNIADILTSGYEVANNKLFCFSSTAAGNGSCDTGTSRGGAGQVDIGTGASGNTAGYIKTAQTLEVTGSNFTCSSGCTSFETITGLSATLPLIAENWSFDCNLLYSQATAAVADQIGVQTATNGATNLTAGARVNTAAGTITSGSILNVASTTTAQEVLSFTPGATGTAYLIHLWGTIEGASASGTVFNVMVLTGSSSDALTIGRGSECYVF